MNIATNRTFFSLFGDKVRFYRSDISVEGDCYMERWIFRTPFGDAQVSKFFGVMDEPEKADS